MGEPLLFLLVAAAAVAVGLARGGALGQLRDHGVKAVWLAVGCLAVQATVVVLPMPGIGGVVLLVAALATLLGIARTNARLAGPPLLALGLILNLIVVLANLGMPVRAETLERAGIEGDRLAVRPLRTVTSYGTVIELAGLFLLLQYLVRGPGPFRREDESGTAHGA